MTLMLSLPIFNPQGAFQGPTGRRNDESDFDLLEVYSKLSSRRIG